MLMKKICLELIDFSAYIIKYGATLVSILFTLASIIIVLTLQIEQEYPKIAVLAGCFIKCIAAILIAFGGFLITIATGNINIKRLQCTIKEYFNLNDRSL